MVTSETIQDNHIHESKNTEIVHRTIQERIGNIESMAQNTGDMNIETPAEDVVEYYLNQIFGK